MCNIFHVIHRRFSSSSSVSCFPLTIRHRTSLFLLVVCSSFCCRYTQTDINRCDCVRLDVNCVLNSEILSFDVGYRVDVKGSLGGLCTNGMKLHKAKSVDLLIATVNNRWFSLMEVRRLTTTWTKGLFSFPIGLPARSLCCRS